MKSVENQKEWGRVVKELQAEQIKLQSYDPTLIKLCGNVSGKRILDYGPGPGILAFTLSRMGAHVQAFDIADEMRQICASRIGAANVFDAADRIPEESYDIVVCNLVLCINDEDEVRFIVKNIAGELKASGFALVGFCNPKIFDVPESLLDVRFATGNSYEEPHSYKKLKKEGWYEILESHRPIEWYIEIFRQAGLRIDGIFFTPEYEFDGRRINDFVIFKLVKTGAEK